MAEKPKSATPGAKKPEEQKPAKNPPGQPDAKPWMLILGLGLLLGGIGWMTFRFMTEAPDPKAKHSGHGHALPKKK